MKIFSWLYAVVGTMYWLMYLTGSEIVIEYAVGPFWLMMIVAPLVLCFLVIVPMAQRMGLFDE